MDTSQDFKRNDDIQNLLDTDEQDDEPFLSGMPRSSTNPAEIYLHASKPKLLQIEAIDEESKNSSPAVNIIKIDTLSHSPSPLRLKVSGSHLLPPSSKK